MTVINPITHRIHWDPSEAARRRLEHDQNLVIKMTTYRHCAKLTQQEMADKLRVRLEVVRDLESRKVKTLDPHVANKVRDLTATSPRSATNGRISDLLTERGVCP